MRVLFTTFAARNHVYSQVSLAWALRAAGHEVCVASQPDIADVITGTGLTAVPVGKALNQEGTMEELRERQEQAETEGGDDAPDAQLLLRMDELRPEKLTYDHMHGVFTAMTSAVLQNFSPPDLVDELVEFARGWRPDLVVWDPLTFAGPVVARVCGAAHARLLFGLDLVGRMRESYVAAVGSRAVGLGEDPLEEWLGWVLERYGCGFGEDLVVGQWSVDPVPSALRLPVGGVCVPVRYVPFNGRAVVPGWLRERPERPRVCVTLGVSHREILGGDQASVGALLDAVAGLDVEVVATLTAEQLGSLSSVPENVRVVDFVPMDVLLPSCAAIINHGGAGTFQTALVHGVPQLIVPDLVWDTVPKAHALERYGAGIAIRDVEGFTPEELRSGLVRILEDPSFAANAGRLRREVLSAPAPSDIVPTLERLTAEHR
jgi:L-2-deoxyfucosyltransferase